MALSRGTFYFGLALFFIVVELPSGEFAVCETCRLGRGKCRRTCLDSEKIAGKCKLNFFCCRERI